MITVEYLLPFDTKDGVCKDINSFKSLLGSNSHFKLESNRIIYKGSPYDFTVEQTEVEDQNCSVFHVSFGISRSTDKFREMLQSFRKTVGLHLQDRIQIVWDGVSFEWAKELYPRIYLLENSMRKLISKFMLTKLGIGWHKSAIPKDVQDSIKNSKHKPSHGILYEVDFIQLSNFLFKEYALKDSSKLPQILNDMVEDGFSENKKREIMEYIPKNNWDRYFSELVNLESDQLRKKWETLYEMRNKVAHNKSMNLEHYERATELCKELEATINEALEKIHKIKIPDKEKESVSLKTIGTINEPTRYFVNEYLDLSQDLSSKLSTLSDHFSYLKDIENPLSAIANIPTIEMWLPQDLYGDLNLIDTFKNDIISGETFLTIDNNINPDIFGSIGDRISSMIDTGDLDLNRLNESLKLPIDGLNLEQDHEN